MSKNKQLVAGLIVVGGLLVATKKTYDYRKKLYEKYEKDIQQKAVDKTVDDFVKAVVTCRQLTIESKHNGCATVRLVVDR